MQIGCGKTPATGSTSRALSVPMDIPREQIVQKFTAKVEFWKGIVVGTIAGMAFAAIKFGILDRNAKLDSVGNSLSGQTSHPSNRETAA